MELGSDESRETIARNRPYLVKFCSRIINHRASGDLTKSSVSEPPIYEAKLLELPPLVPDNLGIDAKKRPDPAL
jgi:hypothetical protein